MKIGYLMTIFAMFALLLSVSALALDLGGISTPASNSDEEYEQYVTGQLYAYANATCEFTLTNPNFVDDEVGISTNNINTSIVKGTTSAIKMRVPETLNAVNPTTLALNREIMGTYLCVNGSYNVASGSVTLQRANEFELKRLNFEYGDGLTATVNSESGDDVQNIKPGDTLDVEIVGTSNFDSDWNVDLDMEITFDSFDKDIDFDDADNLEIGSDEEDSVTTVADIDSGIDAKSYKGYVTVVGKDDFGAYHGEKWSFTLESEREDYEITVDSIKLNPSTLVCDGDKTVTAVVKIINDGDRKDKEVKVELVSTSLSLSTYLDNIEMESADELNKQFTFTVPSKVKPGSYDVTARTYSLGESLSDQMTVKLVVPDCNVVDDTDDGDDDVIVQPPIVITQPPVVINPPVNNTYPGTVITQPTTTTGLSALFTGNSVIYIALLALLVLIVLAAIIGLIVFLIK